MREAGETACLLDSEEVLFPHGSARDQESARRSRGRHRDRQGCRPRGRSRAEARDHGPERLREVDARVRAHGSPRVRGHRGPDPLRRRGPDRARRRRARAARPLPRFPVPARDPRGHGDELPAQRDQREAQGGERRGGRSGSDSRVPHQSAGGDGGAQGPARACVPVSQRRVLRRGEEARRDPADGDAEAEDRGARRDRLRPRHRRAEDRRERRELARRPGDGRARDHALPANPRLRHTGLRARLRRRPHRRRRRPRARAQARGRWL